MSPRQRSSSLPARRGFSLIEMLVALSISATLLTATLVALDASFKSYKATTEAVSTHVVGRLVMYRLSSIVRNGTEFGPFPSNPIVNPTIGDDAGEPDNYMEFKVIPDPDLAAYEVWRIERVDAPSADTGPFHLEATVDRYVAGVLDSTSTRTLARRVEAARFLLEFDVGPRLRRATLDMTLRPDDLQADAINGKLDGPAVRLVTSVAPRRLDD